MTVRATVAYWAGISTAWRVSRPHAQVLCQAWLGGLTITVSFTTP